MGEQASAYVVMGFGAFVLCMIALHCYLKRNERKRINDNLLADILQGINRKGKIVEVEKNDDDVGNKNISIADDCGDVEIVKEKENEII